MGWPDIRFGRKLAEYRIYGCFLMPNIRLAGRISGNLTDIERWPAIRPDNRYLALEISHISGIRNKPDIRYPVSGQTLVNMPCDGNSGHQRNFALLPMQNSYGWFVTRIEVFTNAVISFLHQSKGMMFLYTTAIYQWKKYSRKKSHKQPFWSIHFIHYI